MITIAEFIAFFPEFTDYDPALIQAAITITHAINCGYVGLDDSTRPIALGLAAASYVVSNPPASTPSTGGSDVPNGGGQIRRVKSYDDEIEWFANSADNLEEAQNQYQRTLNTIINNSYTVGIAVSGRSNQLHCGC